MKLSLLIVGLGLLAGCSSSKPDPIKNIHMEPVNSSSGEPITVVAWMEQKRIQIKVFPTMVEAMKWVENNLSDAEKASVHIFWKQDTYSGLSSTQSLRIVISRKLKSKSD